MPRLPTIFIVLLAITVTLAATDRDQLSLNAQKRYEEVLEAQKENKDKIVSLIGVGAGVAGTTSTVADFVKEKTSLTANFLAETLQGIREKAMDKIDSVNRLLNSTSVTEKKVVEKGFEVVNKIINEINEYTGWNITNEYEAAQVSAYIESKIEAADSLLGDIRSYINKYVDESVEKINSFDAAVDAKATLIANVAQDSETTLKNVASMMTDAKGIQDSVKTITTSLGLPELKMSSGEGGGFNMNINYNTIMDTAKAIGNTADTVRGIADSLPEGKAKDKINKILGELTTENITNKIAGFTDKVADTIDMVEKIAGNVANTVVTARKTYDNIVDQSKNIGSSFQNLLSAF